MINFTSALIKTSGFNYNSTNNEKRNIYINPDKIIYFEEHKPNENEIKKQYSNLNNREIEKLMDETKNRQGTVVHLDNKSTITVSENINDFVKLFSHAKQEDKVITTNGFNYIA